MVPALRPGDRLVVVRLPWCWPLRPGQVVVAVDPRDRSRRLVKRVAAVGPGGVQVLGDQPGASTDSRHFGPLARSDVQGRVVYRYGPPGRAGWISGPRSPAGPRYSRP
jgi:nickel-type superoxide dismutase maturation protease